MIRRGFTLIEILVSLAIGLLLVSLAFSAFLQIRKTTERTAARLEMHQRAAVLMRALRTDLSSMMNDCAMYVRTVVDNPATPKIDEAAVELVFMRGKMNNEDWKWQMNTTETTRDAASDLVWTMWRFDAADQTISTATNRAQRVFVNSTKFEYSGPAAFTKSDKDWRYTDKTFLITPKPLRAFSFTANDPLPYTNKNLNAQPWDALNLNTIRLDPIPPPDARAPDDIGDYADLQLQQRPAVRQVTGFRLDLMIPDGTSQTYDGSATKVHVFEGVPMDGTVNAWSGAVGTGWTAAGETTATGFAESAMARRPRLARVLFTTTDARLGLSQTFSISVQMPGMLPGPPP